MTPEQAGRLLEAVERIDKRTENLEISVAELQATKHYWTGIAAGIAVPAGVAATVSAVVQWFKH